MIVCRRCGLGALERAERPGADPGWEYPPEYPAHAPPPAGQRPQRVNTWAAAARALALGYPPPALGPVRAAIVRAGAIPLRRWARRRPQPYFRPGGRLLDVGCGRGDFLRGMRSCGWETCGLDPSPRAVAAARAQGLTVAQGTLPEGIWPDGYFAAITFLDSFEHCPDPHATLAAAARLLAAGGELLILFPDFGSIWRRVFGRYWADIAAPRHAYFYTPAVLRRLVGSAGFTVTATCRRPSADISRSLRIWRRAQGHGEAQLWRWAQLLDRLLARGHVLLRARRRA